MGCLSATEPSPMLFSGPVRSEGLFGGRWRLLGASLSGALAARERVSLRAIPCRYRVASLQDSVTSFH